MQKYSTKTISGESGSSILSSIKPLLDDYKDAIPRKQRQNAFKIIMSAAGVDFEFQENEIALLEIIASKFTVKDKKFNRLFNDAQNVANHTKSTEQERFMEELSKIPGLTKKTGSVYRGGI